MDLVEENHRRVDALVDDLPSTVRVGPFDFSIDVYRRHDREAKWCKNGECSTSDLVIRIDPTLPTPIKLLDTLLHELDHAVWWVAGFRGDEISEEDAVTRTSPVRTGLFRDNPWLTAWIARAAAEYQEQATIEPGRETHFFDGTEKPPRWHGLNT